MRIVARISQKEAEYETILCQNTARLLNSNNETYLRTKFTENENYEPLKDFSEQKECDQASRTNQKNKGQLFEKIQSKSLNYNIAFGILLIYLACIIIFIVTFIRINQFSKRFEPLVG